MLGGMNRFRCPQDDKPVRNRRGWGRNAACALALAGLLGLPPAAPAQRDEKGSVKAPPEASRAGTTTEYRPGSDFSSGAAPPAEAAPSMASLINAQPEGWEIYFKGGAVFPLGDGFFEKNIGTGWTVQVGLRQPLYRPAEPWMLFAEFGGGYMGSAGKRNRPVTTSGVAYFPNDDHIHPTNDFYDTQLIELQRGFFQGALGVFWYPEAMNSPGERLVHLNARFGARTGGMRAIYSQRVRPGLLAAWDGHVGPNRTHQSHTEATAQYFPDAKDPELFFGLFGSFGASMTLYDARLFGRKFTDITFGAEVEFGHEWFNAGAYGHMDPGFGSFTPMLNVSFSF